MSNSKVLEALQKAVIESTAFSTVPVKYLGRSFAIPSDGKWLEIIYIPNNLNDEFLNSGKTYRGILRLLLHWPMDDRGVYEPMEYLETIAETMTKGSKYENSEKDLTVEITDHPDQGTPMEEPPQLLIPLTLQYLCFLP